MRGKRDAALQLHRSILDSEPDDPAALSSVLREYRERGQLDDVVTVSQRALERRPSDFIALDALAWAYVKKGDHEKAKPVVERAIASVADLRLGDVWSSRGPRLMLAATSAICQLPGLRARSPQIPTADAMASEVERDMAEWKAWASEYLAWHASEFGHG